MSTRPLLGDSQPHIVEPADEIAKLRKELRELRDEFEDFRDSLEEDRNRLGSMLHALRGVFSGGATEAVPSVAASPNQPIPSAVYEAWKARLTPACGKIIDALLIQPLSPTQMISICGIAHRTANSSIAILKNNSLIEKDGAKYRLKRL